MRIPPNIGPGNFTSPAQENAYHQAQKVMGDFKELTKDMDSLDNSKADSNEQSGSLVLNQQNVLALTGRTPRSTEQVLSYPERSTDPVYNAENSLSGQVELTADKNLKSMDLQSSVYATFDYSAGNRFTVHESRGFLGMQEPRMVFTESKYWGHNDQEDYTQVSLFADGTMDVDSGRRVHKSPLGKLGLPW